MALHVLVIVLFGTQSGGGAHRGEGWWGPLDVDLRQLAPEQGRGSAAFGPGAAAGEPGAALPRRRAAGREAPSAPMPSEMPVPEAAPPIRPPSAEAPPLLQPNALEELDRAYVPTPLPPPTIEQRLAPPVTLPLREVPVAPIERIAPARIEREVAPPVALPPREVPVAPAAPIAPIAPARIEPEVAPPVALPPREVPVLAPAAPIEPIAPRRLEPGPASVPGEMAPRLERPATPPAAPAAAPTTRPPARAEPVPAEPLPRLRLGAPEPDESIFKPRREVVTPPTEPGGAPHIDREASRQRAREIAARGLESRGVFTLPIPPPPERESKEGRAIDKATKPDCRTAYAGLGLLAVPVLVANAITDSGCKW